MTLQLSNKLKRIEKSPTLAITAIAKKLKAEGVDVVSLSAGEPDFPTPEHIKQAAITAIQENFTYYTATQGIPELIKAICDKFKRDNNLQFEPSQILVSCGGKHSIFNALHAICNPGDEVLIPAPYWVSYPDMAKLADATPVILQTTDIADFKISPEQLRAAITPRTKVLIFNSPSNPTGSVYTRKEIEAIADVIYDTGIYVISDELYEKVLYDGKEHFSIGSIANVRDHIITVNGVSKAYAMTGWRIGYMGTTKEIIAEAEKVQSQATSNPASISQKAALAALTGPEDDVQRMVVEFKKRRDYICKELNSIPGVTCTIPGGAFYVFPNVSRLYGTSPNGRMIHNSTDICKFLLEVEKVAVVPGSAFGSDDYIRLSYACSMNDLEKAIARLKDGFAKLR
jgi:aspartate aminotransferase